MNYIDLVKPTFIENWPAGLCNLSIPQVDLPLGVSGTAALQGEIEAVWHALETGENHNPSDFAVRLASRVDEAIQKFPNGAFVRLGSRSPKDSMLFHDTRGLVSNGGEGINILTHFSERIWEDLYQAIKFVYPVHVFVREWQVIEPWSEFRCFMKNRELVGISQYDYHAGHFPEIAESQSSIRFGIEHFFTRFKELCHLDDVVFDVFFKRFRSPQNEKSWEVRLLEINPFFERTDPCLFDWRNGGNFDGTLKFVKEDHDQRS